MASLEETFQNACATRESPVQCYSPKTSLKSLLEGRFSYAKAFGTRSLKNSTAGTNDGKDESMALDTVMWLASCTKLLTAIAALQCVERRLLDLDSDAGDIWAPLKGMEILKGWDEEGKPIMERAKEIVTLRRLLCHSSGIGYDAVEPELTKWRAYNGQHPNDGINHLGPRVEDRYLVPLLFEPGTSWMYGGSMDMVGKLIEAVNPNHNLQHFFEVNIFLPLGINDLAFFLKDRPDMVERLADLSLRDPTGSGKVVDGSEQRLFGGDIEDSMGGSGLFGTAEDYIKVLESLLRDDGRLLKSETRELVFKPQFEEGGGPLKAMMKTLSDPIMNGIFGGGTPFETKRNWGFGGILMDEDAPGENWRRKGTLSWSGMPNINWQQFIDREKGLCGIYASQVYPPGEEQSHKMSRLFEKAVYDRSKKVTS